MAGISATLAAALAFRYEEHIPELSSSSIPTFARLCAHLIVDSLLQIPSRDFEIVSRGNLKSLLRLLLNGTSMVPVWVQLLPDEEVMLSTVEGKKVNGLQLLRLVGIVTEDGTCYLPRDRSLIEILRSPYRKGTHGEIPVLSKNLESVFEMTKSAGGVVGIPRSLFLFSAFPFLPSLSSRHPEHDLPLCSPFKFNGPYSRCSPKRQRTSLPPGSKKLFLT